MQGLNQTIVYLKLIKIEYEVAKKINLRINNLRTSAI